MSVNDNWGIINLLNLKIQDEFMSVLIEKEMVGILIYSNINPKTVMVHFEFIDNRYDGVAQLLNNCLGKKLQGTHLFINREPDLGIPGLRKSKLSYRPYRLLKKYVAEI